MDRTGMARVFAYMVTWTTYGTWLQGDKRGYVRKGLLLRGSKELERANKRMLRGGAVKLDKREREIIRTAILAEGERSGERILGVSVGRNHVHVVVAGGGKAISTVVSRLKCAAYYEVQKDGAGRRLWTRGYDKRLCLDEQSLVARIRYVERHKG
jgi:hypothetical protein